MCDQERGGKTQLPAITGSVFESLRKLRDDELDELTASELNRFVARTGYELGLRERQLAAALIRLQVRTGTNAWHGTRGALADAAGLSTTQVKRAIRPLKCCGSAHDR